MYADDVPLIAGAMRSDPTTFRRGCLFALLSIQQQFVTVPKSLADVATVGAASRHLFGTKRQGYNFLANEETFLPLYAASLAAVTPADAIHAISAIPSLGIVKSAFVAQLMGHDVACLDTRNIQRDGRRHDEYRSRKDRPEWQSRQIARYVADVGGRAEEYWDAWCSEMAPRLLTTPDAVSRVHRDTIIPAGLEVPPIAVPLPLTEEIPF